MKRLLTVVLFAFLTGCLLALPAQAATTYYWIGGSDYVDVPDNWDPFGLPGNYDVGVIANGGTGYFDDVSQNSFNWLDQLWIGDGSNNNANDYNGGNFHQYLGTLNLRTNLLIGWNNAPGTSNYYMDSGTVIQLGKIVFDYVNGTSPAATIGSAGSWANGDVNGVHLSRRNPRLWFARFCVPLLAGPRIRLWVAATTARKGLYGILCQRAETSSPARQAGPACCR
jgi:hypothetical protein